MVAIAVRFFGQKPVACNARPLLFAAQASLDRGSYIEAGVKLREALRLFLHAECEYWDCLPTKKNDRRKPATLAKALRAAGQLSPDLHEVVVEFIDIGRKAARLAYVRPSYIATALMLMHSFLDGSPYLVQPTAEGRLA